MTYLLDTHTFLWILNAPKVLPASVQSICKNRSATLLISIVTPWEMAIKSAIGKLDAAYVLDNFEALLTQGGFTMLETTIQHVIRGGRLPSHHRDPFDRLIAAQALDLRIPLVSRDRVFDLYGVKRIWD
ncbi:MAG: type II toxin-antitoxin system VapC family toxin [Terracidiphilus sp.]|jgi:PIN domain nuclease of toxin-antitoxin system